MAPGEYFEKKDDIAQLRSRLQNARNDKRLLKNTIKKVIALMTLGTDVTSLFQEMIMASATTDIVQKKLVYLYICSCAESKPDLAVLMVNSLVKDAQCDVNPMVRGLALRSMFNIRIESLIQYMTDPLFKGLKDRVPYVRRNAITAALKLFHIFRSTFEELNIMDKLYDMLRDTDSQVSINAFVAIDEISSGFKFERNYVQYFLDRLPSYNEWSQCILLQKLVNYQPESDEEVIEYLNTLDDRLKHSNKGVVMAAINLFLHFTKNMPSVENDVYDRIRGPILSILTSTSEEIVFAVLNHVLVLCSLKPRLLHKDHKRFFLRNNDPTYVRQKKLEVLTCVVTEGNVQDILDELRRYVNEDMFIACQAIQSIGTIATTHLFSKDICINTLINIIRLEVDYLSSSCLQVIQDLAIKDSSIALHILPEIISCWELIQDHSIGKSAIIWLYGEYGENIPAAPYHLEDLIERIADEQCASVKLSLLTTMMKLFFKRPPECQHLLGTLLSYCIDEEINMDVRDRALFYYRLLSNDIEKARSIVLSTNQSTSTSSYQRASISKEDFRFQQFNTLSIIYNRPESSFTTTLPITLRPDLEEMKIEDESYNEKRVEDLEPNVVEANILDLTEDENIKPQLLLDSSFEMEKIEFQTSWRAMAHSLEFSEHLTVQPEHNEILTVMRQVNVKDFAFTPQSQPIWKFFMYTKMVRNNNVVLIQLIVNNSNLSVTTKSNDRQDLQEFTDFYKSIFIGKWIACDR